MNSSPNIRILTMISLFAALMAAAAFVRIPFPIVPITMQSLVVLTAGLLLRPKYSAASAALYLFLGLSGLPVFAGGGGILYVLKPTFGFLIGFIPASVCIGWISLHISQKYTAKILAAAAGVLVYYTSGTLYLYGMLYITADQPITFWQIFTVQFFVMVAGDILKCLAAVLIAERVKKLSPSHPAWNR